jgi:hypothetical protein
VKLLWSAPSAMMDLITLARKVAKVEECAEAGEEANEKWNHGPGFMGTGVHPGARLNCLNLLPHGIMATHSRSAKTTMAIFPVAFPNESPYTHLGNQQEPQ